jgi:hypothetical protein
LVQEVLRERIDEYLSVQRLKFFPEFRGGAECNKENTIAASACLALVYKRMSVGLATPMEIGWWGERWLNSLKARRSIQLDARSDASLTDP